MSDSSQPSYRQVLKSSTIIGGSSAINIFLGVVRTKILAVLLGPSGMGIVGIYGSITGFVGTLAGMGVSNSGVRQIAEANGSGDRQRIARTILAVRRTSCVLGLIGALLMIGLSAPISQLSFGDKSHTTALSILALAVLFGAVSGGQTALIQGMRQIRNLAALSVLGALFGTLFSIPIVYCWGQKGIPYYLVMISAMGILTSWWYARKIHVDRVTLSRKGVLVESCQLLSLGLVFMSSALMTTAAAYLIRMLIVRKLGVDATGLYQASWTLSSLYVGFVLGAMGADFYPRLTAVAQDNATCNRLVNEQIEVGLLLAAPGIVATLAFAPWVIHFFYSAEFRPAVDVLRWQTLGVLGRVISWPMSYMILAKGAKRLYFSAELLANGFHVSLVAILISRFGLAGTGQAFFALYVFYSLLLYSFVRWLSHFSFTPRFRFLLFLLIPVVFASFLSSSILPGLYSLYFNAGLFLLTSLFCLRSLLGLLGLRSLSSAYHVLRAKLVR